MSYGYVKVDRALSDSPIWLSEPFSRGQAWLDLILSASFKDSFFYVRGNKVSVARGQCAMSQLTMAERWKWSRGKVKRFLNDLENEAMIVQQTGQQTTLVTICNYDKYQGGGTADGTTDRTADEAADGQQTVQQTDNRRGTFKKVKKDKKVKESKEYTPAFESFWFAYPSNRRGSKKNAFTEWQKIEPSLFDKITSAVIARRDNDPDWLKDNRQFVPHAERYLKNERWNDEWTPASAWSDTTQSSIRNLQSVNLQ